TSSTAISLSFFKSIDATCAEPEQAMKALLLSGRMAMSVGCLQIGIVLRTASFCASMSDAELSPRLLTTTVAPSGETRASPGALPTLTVEMTLRAARSMMETFDDAEFATYPLVPSADTSM